MSYNNYPLEQIAAEVGDKIKNGGNIYQKFTCAHCGSRQTMDVPNVLYTSGKCEECGKITDVKKTGCNYMLVLSRHE